MEWATTERPAFIVCTGEFADFTFKEGLAWWKKVFPESTRSCYGWRVQEILLYRGGEARFSMRAF
jgi:hypothetical protein